jgi:hypothetical protein
VPIIDVIWIAVVVGERGERMTEKKLLTGTAGTMLALQPVAFSSFLYHYIHKKGR